MNVVLSGQVFNFSYSAFDQDPGLFVAASLYDVTTGTPVFVSKVGMVSVGLGVYSGNFTGVSGLTYLIVVAVYQDSGFTTLDTSRAASSSENQCVTSATTFTQSLLAFDYTDYGQSSSLNIEAKVYNVTTGTPVLVGSVPMAHVFAGCYFGTFTGTVGQTYAVQKVVYSDPGYTTPDPNRAPAASHFQSFIFTANAASDNIRIRLALAGRIAESQNLAGRLSENIAITGRPLAGRVSNSSNLRGRLAVFGA